MPLVSIIVPMYNAEKTIERCISSVLNQTFSDFELVIINDGSRDNSEALCNSFRDKRIKLFSKQNGGVSSAKNLGIEKAEGSYLMFVDADDSLPQNAVEALVNEAGDGTDLVIGSYEEINRGKKKEYIRPYKAYSAGEFISGYFEHSNLMWGNWTILYRAEIIKSNRILFKENVKYGEDHIFNLNYNRFIKGKVKVISAVVYTYYLTLGSASTKYYPNKAEMDIELLKAYTELFGGLDKLERCGGDKLISGLFSGSVNHYIFYLNKKEALEKTKEALKLYSDYLNTASLKYGFTVEQAELLLSGKADEFFNLYYKSNRKLIARSKASIIYKRIMKKLAR